MTPEAKERRKIKNREYMRKKAAKRTPEEKKLLSENRKHYYKKNSEVIKERVRLWRKKPGKKEIKQKWNEANRDYYIDYEKNKRGSRKEYYRKRRAEDPNYNLAKRLRSRVRSALQYVLKGGGTKCKKTMELLGCSMNELRDHLENSFTIGMSWENMNEWHIDHKIPCDAFDLTEHEEQKICFHYTNLQPLWGKDNQKKSNKILQAA